MSNADFPREAGHRTTLVEVLAQFHAANGSPTPNKMQGALPPRRFVISQNAEMGETLQVEFGRRLRAARKATPLNQDQVGEALGLSSHSSVGQWERGVTLPSALHLFICAELYGVSLDWLVWGMANGLDARVKKLPSILRKPLIERLHRDIEDAERLAARLPAQFGGDPVIDDDERLRLWSAEEKLRQLGKGEASQTAAKKRPPAGTQ